MNKMILRKFSLQTLHVSVLDLVDLTIMKTIRNKNRERVSSKRAAGRKVVAIGMCLLLAVITRADLPATITTTDGQTYNGVSLVRMEPDGYLVNYQPVPNG